MKAYLSILLQREEDKAEDVFDEVPIHVPREGSSECLVVLRALLQPVHLLVAHGPEVGHALLVNQLRSSQLTR